MKRIRYYIFIIGLLACIVLLLYGLFRYADFGVMENELVVISDSQKVFELIAKNTPVRVEIINERWGKAVIEDPEILFDIWNLLNESKTYPSKYLPNQDRLSGNIYFYDGSKEYFSISDRFQVGDYLIENNEGGELDVKKLYRILQYTLATKKNLMKMIESAADIYLYWAKDYFDPESDRMLKIKGDDKRELLSYIAHSNKVNNHTRLNTLLLESGLQPICHIALSLKEKEEVNLVIISILSPDYFNVMDMGFINRNVVYFEGNLVDYCNQLFAKK